MTKQHHGSGRKDRQHEARRYSLDVSLALYTGTIGMRHHHAVALPEQKIKIVLRTRCVKDYMVQR